MNTWNYLSEGRKRTKVFLVFFQVAVMALAIGRQALAAPEESTPIKNPGGEPPHLYPRPRRNPDGWSATPSPETGAAAEPG
jgi:hypothetical protein